MVAPGGCSDAPAFCQGRDGVVEAVRLHLTAPGRREYEPPPMFSLVRAVALALVAALLAAVPAGAALCVKRKGIVVSREQCRKKEKPLSLEGLVAPGEKGDKGDTGAPGQPGVPGGFRVVDANGALVGYLMYSFPAEVLFSLALVDTPVGPLTMFVSPDGFFSPGSPPTFYYETADCTGTAFFPVGFIAFYRVALTWAGEVYYPQEPLAERMLASRKDIGGTCKAYSGKLTVGEVGTFPVASLGLTPPFAARLP
jgi:hypothetical protein